LIRGKISEATERILSGTADIKMIRHRKDFFFEKKKEKTFGGLSQAYPAGVR
jgi:hypothetical protein